MHFLESGGLYGAESVVLNLSREMLKTGDYVPVIACIVQRASEPVALYDKAREHGIEAHKIVIKNKKFPVDIFLFLFRLRKMNIDLVHSHGYKASIICFFAMVLLRMPVLPTCHLWFWGKDSPFKFRLMTALEIFLYRFFKVITVVSEPIKQTLVRRGIRPERIQIINNGINLDDFRPIGEDEKARLREELAIPPGVPVVMNLGRLTEQKAHITIVKAAQIMKKRGVKVLFLIVGDGELRSYLEDQIREYDVGEEVRLLGFRDDAKALLQIADVFLLPSLDEGLPIALLEAMASKVPVIATGVGDVPILLEGGNCGLEIAVNNVEAVVDRVEKVLVDVNTRRKCADNAFNKIVKEYSSAALLNEYTYIYKALMNSD